MKNLLFLVLFSFIISCGSVFPKLSSPPRALPAGITMENSPKAADYPDDSKIVLYESFHEDIDYLIGVGIQTYDTTHRVWKVFKDSAHFSGFFDSFPKDARIKSFFARTIAPDGTITILNKSDFLIKEVQRKSSDHHAIIKTMQFIFPSLQDNAILEYKYTIIYEGNALSNTWWIQSYYPKLESHYTVQMPKWMVTKKHLGWNWEYKVYNYDTLITDNVITEFGDSGDKIYRWHAKNIPTYHSEDLEGEKTRNRGHMRVRVGGYATWKELSYKYFERAKDKIKPTDKLKKKAAELTKDAKTEEEKIKAIYYFVRQFSYDSYHTRYGHGYMPNDADMILERGYGDCKDQSILIIALLRILDINAYPAVIGAGDDSHIDENYQTDYFNHLIVYIRTKDGKDVWLDPTFSTAPYNLVSSFCDDRIAVIIAKKKTLKKVAIRTPKVTPEVTGKEEYKLLIDITPNKKVHTSIAVKSFGEAAGHRMWAFRDLKDDKKIKKYYRREIKHEYADTKEMITNYKYDDPEEKKNYYEMSFNADLKLLTRKQSHYYLDFFPLEQEYADGAGFIATLNRNKRERKHDIRWPSLFRKEIDITIKYPENLKIHSLPQKKEIILADKNLEFSFDIRKVSQGILRLRIVFSRNEKLLDKKEYDALKKFYLDIAKTVTRKIVFEDATTQAEPVDENSTETAPTEGGE